MLYRSVGRRAGRCGQEVFQLPESLPGDARLLLQSHGRTNRAVRHPSRDLEALQAGIVPSDAP
jgi:hypothetical protein